MAKKYMGENDPALDALYEELGAIGTKTRADRKKRRQIERQIRKIRAGRVGGIGGLFENLLEILGTVNVADTTGMAQPLSQEQINAYISEKEKTGKGDILKQLGYGKVDDVWQKGLPRLNNFGKSAYDALGEGLMYQHISKPQLDQFADETQANIAAEAAGEEKPFPTPAQDVLGFGRLEFDIGSRLGLGDAIEAQEDVPIEEIIVDATKRAPTMLATEPKFDISSKLGRNQIRSIEKRRRRMGESPDAFRPDYAIEFLPDHLKEKYRDELLDFAATFSPHESQRASLAFDQHGRRTTPAGQYAHGGILSGQADMLARAGRGDDTMLMHVTPDEVAGIASLAPGMMTINPETGLPEAGAFRDMLGFALPFLGTMVGIPPWVSGAIGAKIRGGDIRDMALGAATGAFMGNLGKNLSNVPDIGATNLANEAATTALSSPEAFSSLAGTPDAFGNLITKAGLDEAQSAAFQSALTSGVDPMAHLASAGIKPAQITSLSSGLSDIAKTNLPDTFGQTMKNIGAGTPAIKDALMSGSGIFSLGGMGLQAQRDMTRRFEEQLLKQEEERERRKAEMYAMYPENIPIPYLAREGGSIYKNRYINGNWS